jgi:homoserine O-succinyltransferase
VSFEEANARQALDGLILTGAPIEQLPYEQVNYWDELSSILTFAKSHISSTLGICWGGLALAKILDIEKVTYPMKIFGVYEATNLERSHPITGDFDDVFACPQSRHSGIDDDVLEQAAREGKVRLLAHAIGAGYVIFESRDRRYLMHLGHPEYEAERIATEYWRDQKKGRTDVGAPTNFDLAKPVNRWRTNCLDFFTQWLRFLFDAMKT